LWIPSLRIEKSFHLNRKANMNTSNLSSSPKASSPKLPSKATANKEGGAKNAVMEPQTKPKEALETKAKLKTESMDSPVAKTAKETKEPESKEVQEYLKAIDRLEKGVTTGEISEEDLDAALNGLEEKILALSPTQKKKLLSMDFFVQNKIEDLKVMKKTMTEYFDDLEKRNQAFDLLKDQQFIAILNDLPEAKTNTTTYDQSARPNQAQPISTKQIKA